MSGINGLVNSATFAKLCGVAPQTILNWVKSGKLIPAQDVGGKYFFSKENFYSVQLDAVKCFANQSFLGIIVEEDDSATSSLEAKFVSAVHSSLPNARKIKSVSDSLDKLFSSDDVVLDEQLYGLFASEVASAFVEETRIIVLEAIFNIYKNVKGSSRFSLDFFLNAIFGEENDEGLVADYMSLPISDSSFALSKLASSVQVRFDGLKNKFGVSVICSNAGLSIKSAYEGSVDAIISSKEIITGQYATRSQAIYDRLGSSVSRKSARLALQSIFENGYFSTVTGVGSLSAEQEAFIFKSLLDGVYKTYYLSNRGMLSPQLLATLDSLVRAKRINLLEV